MMVDNTLWLPEEEEYLSKLSRICQIKSIKHRNYYMAYKRKDAKFKIPAIIVSAITGLVSFGTSSYPEDSRELVSIFIGISAVSIAIVNSIESYMKIGEIMAGCLQASISLQKLKEHIDIELLLPPSDRGTQGILFLRDVYSKYEKINELAPNVFKTIYFVNPYELDKKLTEITTATSSTDLEVGRNKRDDGDNDNSSSKELRKLKTIVLA
jgi:hypothetical protein